MTAVASDRVGARRAAPLRVLLAKPGLDGHDRGVKVVARTLRDAGMEVIYTGLRRSVEEIVAIAEQEDPDVVALSILSGAHLGLVRKLFGRMHERGLDIPVIVGGTIPPADVPRLRDLGAAAVFGVGTDLDAIVSGVRSVATRDRTND